MTEEIMAHLDHRPNDGPQEAAVITKAVLRAATNLELTNKVLGKILGLSEATISRVRSNQKLIEPSEKAFELAALFVRMYRALDAITGGDDGVSSQWLQNKNTILNACPLDMIQSIQGLVSVIQYLDARRAIT
jgi:hypothetical protein